MSKVKAVENMDNIGRETIVYYGVNTSSFIDYVKAGVGMYIGYRLAERFVPIIKNKIKKN